MRGEVPGSKEEGGNVFGIKLKVVITFLVKQPHPSGACQISYCPISDFLTKEEKLHKLQELKDISRLDWQTIHPNEQGDWLNQRRVYPDSYYDLISTESESIFEFKTPGISTNRDADVYDFSANRLEAKIKQLIDNYHKYNINSTKVSWTDKLKKLKKRNHDIHYNAARTHTAYRLFCSKYLHYQEALIERPGRFKQIFNTDNSENLLICVSTQHRAKGFGVFLVNKHVDLHLLGDTTCIPRYYFASDNGDNNSFDTDERICNISNFALSIAKKQYRQTISADDIFYYIYGFLHSREYRKMWATNLSKNLPKIPFVKEKTSFWRFVEAGRQLADLHLNYENQPSLDDVEVSVEKKNYLSGQITFDKTDKSIISFNSNIVIKNIPPEVHEYILNGHSAIDWVRAYYSYPVNQRHAGQVNQNPNDWADEVGNSRYVLDLLLSVITVSKKTMDIVESLPKIDFTKQ